MRATNIPAHSCLLSSLSFPKRQLSIRLYICEKEVNQDDNDGYIDDCPYLSFFYFHKLVLYSVPYCRKEVILLGFPKDRPSRSASRPTFNLYKNRYILLADKRILNDVSNNFA